MTPQQFWLILAGFLGLVLAWFVAAKVYLWAEKRRNLKAAAAAEPEPDPDDLDAKWSAYWHKRDVAHRNTELFAWLHADEEAIGREIDAVFAKALDDTQEILAVRGAGTLDRATKRLAFAGAVDMFAQWLYVRRRNVKRAVLVLEKTETLPPAWQRQLRILIDQAAVARSRDEVRAR